jgi:hypothetical protein
MLQGVCEMEAGSEQCKEPDEEKLLRVDCRWIVDLMVKLACFVKENGLDRGGQNVIGERKR